MRRIITTGAIVVGIMALAGCGGGDGGSDGAASATTANETTTTTAESPESSSADEKVGSGSDRPSGVTIKTGDSQFGDVLFGKGGQAIYLFEGDRADESACFDDCAAAWPPVLTKGEPQAGGEVGSKLLATIERPDGSTQVTYNGHPLYYYVNEGPGEVRCNNVNSFGGLWFAVDPSGDAV